MSNFYSASTGGLYDTEQEKYELPTDCVEMTAESYSDICAKLASGHVLQGDADGNPVAVEHTLSEGEKKVALQVQAQIALNASDIVVVRAYEAEAVVTDDWKAYRTTLRAIISGTSSASELPQTPETYPA